MPIERFGQPLACPTIPAYQEQLSGAVVEPGRWAPKPASFSIASRPNMYHQQRFLSATFSNIQSHPEHSSPAELMQPQNAQRCALQAFTWYQTTAAAGFVWNAADR
jgi:hypothetical protein